MNIVYSTSDTYYPFCKTSIYTLLKNNKESNDIRLFIISNGVSVQNENDLRTLCAIYNVDLTFINGEVIIKKITSMLEEKGGKLNFNPSSFLRLFLTEILPENVEKVLLVDSDTYVADSLQPLYDLDISNYPCAMTYDQPIWINLLREIDFDKTDEYFNAGVMLVNLKLWREEGILHALLNYYFSRGGNFLTDDQSVLNAVLRGRILFFEYKYNVMQWTFYWSYKKFCEMNTDIGKRTKEEFNQSVNNPAIVHFAGPSIRPWERWCAHPYTHRYRKALKECCPQYRIANPRGRSLWRAIMNYWKHILVDGIERKRNL